jgi:transcriptional regulator with XRE-family HTH domain
MTIGQRIKIARILRKYTQRELASKLDVCTMFISELERDIRKPSVSTVIKLSDALDVSTDYLLKGTAAK